MPDLPPAGRLTLDDIDAHGLTIEAACPACAGYRRIRRKAEPLPGWTSGPPLADLFGDGKVTCRIHGRPAIQLRVLEPGLVMGEPQVVAEWRVS